MNKNGFKGKCKINKIIVSNDTLTSICIIIGSSCFLALILSACASKTSIKSTKSPAVIVSKPNSVVMSEAERTRGEFKDSRQSKVPPALNLNNIKEAINYSNKTSMLSMRMANLYGIQVLQDYPAKRKQIAKKQLKDAMRTANDIYKALLTFAPVANQPKLKQKVKMSQDYWFQLERTLSKEPTKKGFLDVLGLSDKLLNRNDTMAKLIETHASDHQSKFINIAGRQQMYVMKLSRDYLAASMGVDKEHRMGLMLETLHVFDIAMLALEGASNNTADIKGIIKSITKMEWKKVYQMVNECIKDNGTKFNLFVMINFCETLLEKTGRLTMLYTEARTVTVEQELTSAKKEPLKRLR